MHYERRIGRKDYLKEAKTRYTAQQKQTRLHRISAASILASAADKSMHFDWTGFKRISTDHHLAAQQIGRFTAEIRK
jgi:hypothetical protein